MPRRERLRPVAERSGLAGDRRAKQLGQFDQLLFAAAPGDFVADADERILGLDQHARRFLDILLVGADTHRHIEFAALPDLRFGVLGERIGRQRQEHGAAGRRRGEFQGAPRGLRHRLRRLRLPVPFGDRLGHQLVVVDLLPLIAAKLVLADRGDRDQHRDLVLVGIHHLRHGVGQADIGDHDNAGAPRRARVAVRHAGDRAFLHALDDLDLRHVDERVEDRMIAGRRIEEDIFDAGRLELLDEQLAAVALDFTDRRRRRRGGSRRFATARTEWREILRHRLGGHRAHAERAQAGHQLAARQTLIEVLFDQLLH